VPLLSGRATGAAEHYCSYVVRNIGRASWGLGVLDRISYAFIAEFQFLPQLLDCIAYTFASFV